MSIRGIAYSPSVVTAFLNTSVPLIEYKDTMSFAFNLENTIDSPSSLKDASSYRFVIPVVSQFS